MITVRLPPDLETQLSRASKISRSSKGEVIKKALRMFFEYESKENTPYELGKDIFGKYSLGDTELSGTYKAKLKKKINEKHHH